MALQPVTGGVWFPAVTAEGLAFTSDITFDALADRAGQVFPIPAAGTIDKVTFRIGALTTAISLDIRLETVSDTTGFPTGVLWATNTSGSLAVPTANTTFEVTVSSAATVAVGDLIALVIQPSGTPVNLGIARISTETMGFISRGPYGVANTTGSYTITNSIMASLHYSGGAWLSHAQGMIDTFTTASFSTSTSATTGTARGIRFRLPFKARLGGCLLNISTAAGADITVVLYSDAGSTLLTSQTIDKDTPVSTGSRSIPFTTTYDLAASTWYRLAVVPSGAAIALRELTILNAAQMETFSGGTDVHLCAFVSSAWVDTTTTRPRMFLWLTHLDDGVSTGGQNRAILPSGVSALG